MDKSSSDALLVCVPGDQERRGELLLDVHSV